MAWEWSHTPEAYAAARARVMTQHTKWLRVVWSEWEAHTPATTSDAEDEGDSFDESHGFDLDKYNDAFERARSLPDDVLAESIWERMEEQALCENGGHQAWACPHGCGCHLISFDEPHPRSKAADYMLG